MRILIVADLMGASAVDAPPLDRRPVIRVDVDRFDEAFTRFAPSVALPAIGLTAPLPFDSIEDFHPDRLFERVALFDRFRSLRQRLQDPATFRAAADELRADGTAQPSESPAGTPATAASNEEAGSTFERLLGAKPVGPRSAAPASTASSGIDAFVNALVAPYIVAKEDPQLPQFLSAVDAAIGDTMRAVLHDAAFQRLESSWRSVQWLLQRTGEMDEAELEIFLVHLTRDEFRGEALGGGVLARRLEARAADVAPWSLIVADFSFGPSEDDLQIIQGLATLSSDLGVPLVAAAAGSLVGCNDVRAQADPNTWTALPAAAASLWADIRSSGAARSLGLTWPRLLTRLPYGVKADPIEAFAFEEMPADHGHEDYLWGNGAFAVALTMARMHLGAAGGFEGDIGDLPAFTYLENGEPTLKPGAEFCMAGRAADEALARGIMPLLSYQNRNAVRLVRLQSIGATSLG